MIELTDAAERKLLELRGDDPERAYVRLYVAGRTCCSYRYGLAFESDVDPQDSVVEVEGIRLVLDPRSRPLCDEVSIDFVHTADGAGFAVRGQAPEGGGCGCGRLGRRQEDGH
jgi:iron-sulfur cluster assembly accessory protein